ncbi:hypothetical protein TEA_005772 [Camellia sinensis var. sinensis]|uniref:ferric-chelate reductase (NADH) n=1 Tax=Camellia sinensis var. sinensis TaxID=542762 RepID=A0A4S4EGQ6_CAMSN|nr:hypothetical protein TEA_005772 [Camellia sinensis var. sinensis]
MVDRFLRILQSRQSVHLVSARVISCEIVELNFSKSRALSYTPTSIIFINVPSISRLQWHPFTISSSSNLEPDELSIIIKNEGSWSEKLYQMLSSPSPVHHLRMSIEGPYGLFLKVLKWSTIRVSNVAGELSLLFGLLLWVTTYPRIRQKMFELFFYTHHLYILFMIFYIFHLGFSYSYTILPGFYLFMVDRFLRFLQSRQGIHLVSARVMSCETVELNYSKSRALSYTPTSIIFINVPSISRLQWHPFTISSSSNLEPDELSIIIKNEGSWSEKLYQMLSSPSPVHHLRMSIEGPYGPISTDFLRHDVLVMVSGGSGIAPFISITRDLIFTTSTLKSTTTPQILLISAFKFSSDLAMLDLLFPHSKTPSELLNLELHIEAYITREKQPISENEQKPLRTIRFKPNPSDAPLSPTLGPNGWLWLGAIVSSSFIVFLLFMGILTRFYIYPIDHNTNRVYSHTSQAMLNMLLVCIAIAMTGCVGFVWSKKQIAMEATKQVQDMEGGKLTRFSDDRELESLPHQSIGKPNNVHYGGRPDLKRILLERKESSVGVLVCGPKNMRHEVAAICSSGLAHNLHFESISFSW